MLGRREELAPVMWVGTVFLLAWLGFLAVRLRQTMRRIRSTSLRGVVEALRANPGTMIDFDNIQGLVWNPSKPLGSGGWITMPGHATYWREGEDVHLQWTPRYGREQHLVGPLIDLADETPEARRDSRKALAVIALVVLVTIGGWWLLNHLVH